MFSTTIDNAIIAYARNATGISKAIWSFQNAEKETAPFIAITPLNITDLDGVRSETGYKHKGVSLRFNVYKFIRLSSEGLFFVLEYLLNQVSQEIKRLLFSSRTLNPSL